MVRYHPFSAEVFDDPFPLYRELREEAPAHYLEEFDCWFLSRFDESGVERIRSEFFRGFARLPIRLGAPS